MRKLALDVILGAVLGGMSLVSFNVVQAQAAPIPAWAVPTLKSTSGLCHPAGTRYYSQVTVTPNNQYTTLDECLKKGKGELPKYLKAQMMLEDPVAAEEVDKVEKDNKAAAEKVTREGESVQKFAGLNWGPGLMFAFSSEQIIKEVSIEVGDADNNTVRVDHELKKRAIAVLESHYFFTPGEKDKFGVGPFVSIGLVGEDGIDPLSLFGLGVMFGFRQDGDRVSSWNFGFGYYIDTEAKTLRGDLKDGSMTSETDRDRLTRKSDIDGLQMIFSASF